MNALPAACRLNEPRPPQKALPWRIIPTSDDRRPNFRFELIGLAYFATLLLAAGTVCGQAPTGPPSSSTPISSTPSSSTPSSSTPSSSTPSSSTPSSPTPGGSYGSGSYGSDPGGVPAKPTANLTVGPTPISMFQLIQPDWKPLQQQIVRIMTPSATPSKPPILGPMLRNEANVAFRYGNLDLARELYFGFLAYGSTDSKEDLDSLQFSNYFRRPVWQLRWGVSLGLHGDTTVTDFSPIKAGPAAAGGGATAMDSAMAVPTSYDSSSSSSSPGASVPSDSIANMRSGDPNMGMGMGMGMGSGSGPSASPQYDSSGRLVDPSLAAKAAPQAQMTDPSISERFEELMGYVATTVTEGMSTRMASGQFGPAFANVDPDAKDQGDTVAGDYVQPSEPRMWIPSVVYLGEGSTQEMSKAAATQGVELLLHFDVALKEVRNSTPQNSSRVKVIDGRTGRTLITSTEMDNRELQKMVQAKRGTAESYVNDALEKFWSILDSKLSVQPFPKLTPEVARRRVTGVLAEPSFSLLRKLAEIRFMGSQGWLTADEVEEAYSIAAGTEGMTILYGSESDAVGLIQDIAKRSATKTP